MPAFGLLAPSAGETLRLPVMPGDAVLIGFDPYDVGVVFQGDDLVFIFENGGRIVLEGFAAAASEDRATAIQLPNGVTVAGEAVVAQFAEEGLPPPLETAAGDGGPASAPSSGGGLVQAPAFDQTLGDVVELIETLVLAGVLPSTTLGFVSARMTAALQTANSDNILLLPGPAPVVAPVGVLVLVAPVGVTPADRVEVPFAPGQVIAAPLPALLLPGTEADDLIEGGLNPERLEGLGGDDTLLGNGGDDVLDGGPGTDVLDGGAGSDAADYSGSDAAVTVSLAAGTGAGGEAEGDTLTAVESLIGSAFDDTLTGDDAANTLTGGAGADSLDGGGGSDTAAYDESGAAVSVSLVDGSGTGGDAEGDTLTAVENLVGSDFDDTLLGGAGDNSLTGGLGADSLDGGGGSDTAVFRDGLVTVNLAAGTAEGGDAEGDSLTGIENIVAQGEAGVVTDAGNVLIGDGGDNRLESTSSANDTLDGAGGNDRLVGGAGDDLQIGGAGNDVLVGGPGDDTIQGGPGLDTLDYRVAFDTGAVPLDVTEGVFVDLLFGVATGSQIGSDTISGIEIVLGGDGDDIMFGDDGVSTAFDGGGGIDTFSVSVSQFSATIDLEAGLAQGINIGFDSIANFENATGGTVDDTILGTAGDNEIRGLGGADTLTGRGGADTFLYSAGDGGGSIALADVIADFEDGIDRIGLLDGLGFGTGAGEAQFVAANGLGLTGVADDTALVITDGAGTVTEVLAVIDSVAVADLDADDVIVP